MLLSLLKLLLMSIEADLGEDRLGTRKRRRERWQVESQGSIWDCRWRMRKHTVKRTWYLKKKKLSSFALK